VNDDEMIRRAMQGEVFGNGHRQVAILAKHIERLRAQRDRAWIALAKIQDITETGEPTVGELAFALAGSKTCRDGEEFNAVITAAEAAGGEEIA
jgi:hypothetical protein